VTFEEPRFAPAPGQIAVFYEGDRVVVSGKIRV
jgi:tRNA U34 2-thiouridine synthase MnmA/TrmU